PAWRLAGFRSGEPPLSSQPDRIAGPGIPYPDSGARRTVLPLHDLPTGQGGRRTHIPQQVHPRCVAEQLTTAARRGKSRTDPERSGASSLLRQAWRERQVAEAQGGRRILRGIQCAQALRPVPAPSGPDSILRGQGRGGVRVRADLLRRDGGPVPAAGSDCQPPARHYLNPVYTEGLVLHKEDSPFVPLSRPLSFRASTDSQ